MCSVQTSGQMFVFSHRTFYHWCIKMAAISARWPSYHSPLHRQTEPGALWGILRLRHQSVIYKLQWADQAGVSDKKLQVELLWESRQVRTDMKVWTSRSHIRAMKTYCRQTWRRLGNRFMTNWWLGSCFSALKESEGSLIKHHSVCKTRESSQH